MNTNRQYILDKRPIGLPDDSTFRLIELDMPQLEQDEVLVQTHYMSVDPYMRWRMNDMKSYTEPYELGKPLTASAIGEVVQSKHPGFKIGDFVTGRFDWADYTVCSAADLERVEDTEIPLTSYLHVVGISGLTAYFGLFDIGKPQPSETIVVSGAAGSVGMIVGQIAKMVGCRVIGIAGSDQKITYLKEELGFDEAINYKKSSSIKKELEKMAPNGVDIYFDNVGGEISDDVLFSMNFHSRVILCGQIAHYNTEDFGMGPRVFPYLLQRSTLIKGFIVRSYSERFPEGRGNLSKWLKEGKIKCTENIIVGLENAPEAFRGLFNGENIGKQLVKIV